MEPDRRMIEYYDRDGKPITLMEWAALMGNNPYKRIELDYVDDATVSTVWLGLDHNFLGEGPPLIFETMIFGGEHDQWQQRYSTEHQARAGHDQVVAALRTRESWTALTE